MYFKILPAASTIGSSLAAPLSDTLLTTRALNSADHTAIAHRAFTTLAKQICISDPHYYCDDPLGDSPYYFGGTAFGTHGWGPKPTRNGGFTLNFGERQYGINLDGARFWKDPGRQNGDLQSFKGPGCDDCFEKTGVLSSVDDDSSCYYYSFYGC